MQITLKAARVNAGLTQQQVADVLNVDKRTIGSWENGVSFPKPDKINRICELYNVSYDDIRWGA